MLRSLLITFATLLVAVAGSRAQPGWPPVYELKTDTTQHALVLDDRYWQMSGSGPQVSFREIESPAYSNRFHANSTVKAGLDYQVPIYWQRYRVWNNTPHALSIAISEGISNATVYHRIGGGPWITQRTGHLVPWSERRGLRKLSTVIIRVPAGDTATIYEKNALDYRYTRPTQLQVTLHLADRLIEQAYFNNERKEATEAIMIFIMGTVFFAALLNLFFYSAVRERVYLFYGLALMSSVLKFESSPMIAFYREHPEMYYYFRNLFFSVQFFFFVQTSRYFVHLQENYPRFDRVLSWLNYIAVGTYLLAQLVLPGNWPAAANAVSLFYNWLSLAVFISLFVILLLFIRKKDFDSRSFVISALPMVGYILLEYSRSLIPVAEFQRWFDRNNNLVESACIIWLVGIFTWSLMQRFNRLKRENEHRLEAQVATRTADLNRSLEELKATQSQLIQSEKMASLGELTAGIAHEIQNPLNFVNNFSEVSGELVEELKEEMEHGEWEAAAEIADDIKLNLDKIAHHGKRADNIVKGMLQHSRSGSDVKELVPINTMVDEYLRLSYHGFRAKDKSFNATLHSDLDPLTGNALVLPQELGRVILNLLNNAFYAVNARGKLQEGGYQPTVNVSTRREDNRIRITIRDNGTGIPPKLRDKIFQPFFTTKPTGEGTGLGLSLSYDIVTKAHGGELSVTSEVGSYTEFIISLPASA